MAVIRIERVPVSVGGLGLLGFDHLQLVLQQDDYDPRLRQDNWYVMEGVREFGADGFVLGVEGGNGATTLSAANGGLTGSDLTAAIGTAAQRGSRVLPIYDAASSWQLMADYAREIDLQHFPYISFGFPGTAMPTVNSTSVIASLLYYIGQDLNESWPSGTRFSPGSTTLLGTRSNDNLSMGANFNTLLGGLGNDTLQGSDDDRTDKIYGGAGNDIIKWSAGFNYLHGGEPRMDYASDGIDVVDYAGAGIVEIESNENYVPHKTPTFTATHANGVDYLFSIDRLQWNSASDQIIIDGGRQIMQDGLIMGFGGEGSGHGDSIDFSARTEGLLITDAGNDQMVVKDVAAAASENGIWLEFRRMGRRLRR